MISLSRSGKTLINLAVIVAIVTDQPSLEPGLSARVSHRVRSDDISIVFGSGEVPVLATPRALAWCEEATVRAIAGSLVPGITSVGLRVNLDHLKPSVVGTKVFADAVLEKVDGRRITFSVQLESESGELLAVGRVVRVLVDLERFLSRVDDTGQIPVVTPK